MKEIEIKGARPRPKHEIDIVDSLPVGSMVNGVTKAKEFTDYKEKNEKEEEEDNKKYLLTDDCILTKEQEDKIKEKFIQDKADEIMKQIQEFSKEYVPGADINKKEFISEKDMIKIAAKLFGIDLDTSRKRHEKLEKAFEELAKEKEYGKPECEIVEKLVPGYFDGICQEMIELHRRKNKDYGNAAHESYKEFGLISYVIRLNDKMNRLKSLMKPGVEQEVKNESIEDTLMDLAAYAIMAIESLRS